MSIVPLTLIKTLLTFGEMNLCISIHQPCGISSRANSNPTSSWYLGRDIVFNFKTIKVLGFFRGSTRTSDVFPISNFINVWCDIAQIFSSVPIFQPKFFLVINLSFLLIYVLCIPFISIITITFYGLFSVFIGGFSRFKNKSKLFSGKNRPWTFREVE